VTTALPRSTVAGLEAATTTAAELCHALPMIHALSSVLYDCTHEPADGFACRRVQRLLSSAIHARPQPVAGTVVPRLQLALALEVHAHAYAA
jgi:hypothetical protein